MAVTRIACLYVPLFPLAARLRAEPELAGEAVVVCEGNGAAARVVAASRVARRTGIKAGVKLAQARAILPSLIARGRDPGSEESAQAALLEVAWGLSPRIEAAARDLVFADVSGMECLYPGARGEPDMALAVIVAAESFDLLIRIGIATNKLAARIASRQPNSPTVIGAGEESRFLAPLPLRELELEPRLAATLFRWGVTTIGDLARLPADRVASRLGRTGLDAHKSACGIDSSPLETHQPPPTIAEGLELEWPVVTVEPLLYAIGQSLDRIRRRLERQDLASTSLDLELALEPSGSDRRTIRLPAPTRDVDALLALIRLELEARPPRSPVAAFACAVRPDRPRRGQLTLFGSPDIHPDKLAATLARLHARLGPDRVGSPRTVNAHLPERFENAPFDPPPTPKLQRSPGNGRGLLVVRVLRPPVALEVIVEEEDSKLQIENCKFPTTHPSSNYGLRIEDCGLTIDYPSTEAASKVAENEPLCPDEETPGTDDRDGEEPICNLEFSICNLRLVSVASVTGATPRIQGLVRVAAGPWALEEGWWRREPVARVYWDVELSGGGLYRIYQDRRTWDWFADGMYD